MGSGRRAAAVALAAFLAGGADAKMRVLRLRLPPKPAAVPAGADWSSFPDRDHDGLPDAAQLSDPRDRGAFRQWTCALALRQAKGGLPAEGPFRAARDCADLLDIVFREALKRHDQRWRNQSGWTPSPDDPARDVAHGYPRPVLGTSLFRTEQGPAAPERFGPSATASVLRELNARPAGRSLSGLEDGDLLFFQHPEQGLQDHGMLYCGERVVYHTGPSLRGPGRVKVVSLERLLQHPDPSWRPLATNPHFLGVYRWRILD